MREHDLSKVEFKDEKRFLSNMWVCPILFTYPDELKGYFDEVAFDELIYGSSEHIYQALKSTDPSWHKLIRETEKPTKTKSLAAQKLSGVKTTDGTPYLREDWLDIKGKMMLLIVFLKFTQNDELKDMLLALPDDYYIEERNDWDDIFWGTVDGEGQNHLGIILAKMRQYFIDGDIKNYLEGYAA